MRNQEEQSLKEVKRVERRKAEEAEQIAKDCRPSAIMGHKQGH
jgi:hypothetical protein